MDHVVKGQMNTFNDLCIPSCFHILSIFPLHAMSKSHVWPESRLGVRSVCLMTPLFIVA